MKFVLSIIVFCFSVVPFVSCDPILVKPMSPLSLKCYDYSCEEHCTGAIIKDGFTVPRDTFNSTKDITYSGTATGFPAANKLLAMSSLTLEEIKTMFVYRDNLYVFGKRTGATQSGLHQYDLSDKYNPTFVQSGLLTSTLTALDMFVDEDFIYLARGLAGSGLWAVNRTTLAPYDTLDISFNNMNGVFAQGGYIYATDAESTGQQNARFLVAKLTSSSFTLVGTYTSTDVDSFNFLHVEGNYAYLVKNGDLGFRILNITEKNDPNLKVTYTHTTSDLPVRGASFQNDFMYLTRGKTTPEDTYFEIVSVADKGAPASSSYTKVEAGVNYITHVGDVSVSGNYAYVSVYSAGIVKYLITSPTNPTVAMTQNLCEGRQFAYDLQSSLGVLVEGDYMYTMPETGGKIQVAYIKGQLEFCGSCGSEPGTRAASVTATDADGSTKMDFSIVCSCTPNTSGCFCFGLMSVLLVVLFFAF